MADSARPSAYSMKFADLTMPRRPICSADPAVILQTGVVARVGAKCGIESRQRAWSPKCARNLDRRPGRRSRKPTVDTFQRRADTLVNYQSRGRSHPNTGIEYVDVVILFHVEPIQMCGGVHARHHPFTGDEIKAGEFGMNIRRGQRVDAVPHSNERAPSEMRREHATRHHRQQLLAGCHSAVRRQHLIDEHASNAHHGRRPSQCCAPHLWMSARLVNGEQTQKHATRRGFRCVCVCSPGEVLALGALVGGHHSRTAETDVVLQRRGDVVDLTLVRGSPQLPGQLGALRETRSRRADGPWRSARLTG